VAVTGNTGDDMVFKVPVLRNIELTYPYFHDGQVATLEEAVELMGRLQLGREFSAEETGRLVAFLRALTGEQPQFALPLLPPSTASTPQPSPFVP
jgi:cytochrome c peroxidase